MALLWRVRTAFTGIPGSPYVSTMHFEHALSGPAVVVDRVRDFWTGMVGIGTTPMVATVEGDVSVIDEATGLTVGVESTADLVVTFTGVTERLPPANQILVRWQTGLFPSGRQVMGKTFVPGVSEANATAGTVQQATRDAIQVLAAALIAPTDERFVVYSRKNLAGYRVLTSSVWEQFAVLRSRRD